MFVKTLSEVVGKRRPCHRSEAFESRRILLAGDGLGYSFT